MRDAVSRPVTRPVTRPADDGQHADRPSTDVAKVRPCLRCKTPFPSKWAGERICSRCKGTTTWRSGEALSTVPMSRRS
jgi:hypothetical protein